MSICVLFILICVINWGNSYGVDLIVSSDKFALAKVMLLVVWKTRKTQLFYWIHLSFQENFVDFHHQFYKNKKIKIVQSCLCKFYFVGLLNSFKLWIYELNLTEFKILKCCLTAWVEMTIIICMPGMGCWKQD